MLLLLLHNHKHFTLGLEGSAAAARFVTEAGAACLAAFAGAALTVPMTNFSSSSLASCQQQQQQQHSHNAQATKT